MNYLIIKFGGSVLEELPKSFYDDVVEIQNNGIWQPIIVHGGGPLISKYLSELQMETTFINGMRKTTEDVLNVVEMVLSGIVNKKIVRHINQSGGDSIGISGVDGNLLLSSRTSNEELGYVGKVEEVNDELIKSIVKQNYIPVVSPVGIDKNGNQLNINGDLAAAAIAKALGGTLCFVSNIPGIYINDNEGRKVLSYLTRLDADKLIANGQINQGMIPKVQAAVDALTNNVSDVVILNGKEKGSLLNFCDGSQIGTRIVN